MARTGALRRGRRSVRYSLHGIGSSPGAMARTGALRRGCPCARHILWGGHDVLLSSSTVGAAMPDTL
ncbi:hypothetical protein [uncultured Duncaniella sp.]|nr:hypothetical protein [uncultured Duncaniella sp.]